MNNFRIPAHVCLGVPTYQRPQMLSRCLASIRRLEEPDGVRLSIVVVDNEAAPSSAEMVQFLAAGHRPIHYEHEPRRGIAQARNAILDKAAELGADWVAMLDDDQTVEPGWLLAMWNAVRFKSADVARSSVEMALPEPMPKWAFPKRPRRSWAVNLRHVATNGVLFRANLMDVSGAPLRFNERLALTGGEDMDFFTRAVLAGARIVRTPEAIATEFVPASKLTYSAQMWRSYWVAFSNTRRDINYHGALALFAAKPVKLAGAVLRGALALIAAPFAALLGAASGRKQLLKAGKQLATAAGIAAGLTGVRLPQPYRTIHGG